MLDAAERFRRVPPVSGAFASPPPRTAGLNRPGAVDEWLHLLIVAVVLLQTSIAKLIDPQPTLEVFTDWAGFPVLLGRVAFVALVTVELLLVVWLLAFRRHRAPAWVALGLMDFFTGVLMPQLATGWEGDCGCGGPKLGHAATYSLGLGATDIQAQRDCGFCPSMGACDDATN